MGQRPRAKLGTASSKRNRKSITPEAIFVHAVRFHAALRVLREHKPTHLIGPRMLDLPVAVINALCIELFLKALVCIETGRNPKGHHLLNLFTALSVKTRNRIIQLWDGYAAMHAHRWVEFDTLFGKPVPRDLPTALLLGSRTFELARYYYEEAEEFVFYIGILPDMLAKVAFELVERTPVKDITVEG
jgi:hypothetical protein